MKEKGNLWTKLTYLHQTMNFSMNICPTSDTQADSCLFASLKLCQVNAGLEISSNGYKN